LFNPATPEAAKQLAIDTLTLRLQSVAQQLSTKTFLLGEHFTVADAYLFVTLAGDNMLILKFPAGRYWQITSLKFCTSCSTKGNERRRSYLITQHCERRF